MGELCSELGYNLTSTLKSAEFQKKLKLQTAMADPAFPHTPPSRAHPKSPIALSHKNLPWHRQRQTIRGQCEGSQNQFKPEAGGTLVSLKRHDGGALQGGATASPSSAFSLGKSVALIRSFIILSTNLQSLERSIKGSTKLGPVKICCGHSLR